MRLGIDIGGTFTDFALDTGGALVLDKVLSTPQDRSIAVMQGIERLARRQDLPLAEFLGRLEAIVHGTTVADNTLIEGNGAVTGLLTTDGWRDELELRRGFKEDIWDVRLPAPRAIVPRRRRLGVRERVRFDGTVHTPLDEVQARAAIRRLGALGVESVAVSTLFSFVNPAHEQRLAALVREELPQAALSLSHEVMPKAPEFERTSTTVINAHVGPRVSGYLDRLGERLREAGYRNRLLVVTSSGGVMTREYLRGSPVRILASGPAGGVIGAAVAGRAKGQPDLLCVDMGGTSYDVSVVRRGEAPAEPGWNWHHRYVIGLPMVSVETLGAGGGSLCRVEHGQLRVGPQSAGAAPGPICYGRGGTVPTVTDAMLVLGLLSEQAGFAGGSFQLTRDGVEAGFREHVAGPLGCTVEEAAFDCWRVVNANMTQAVRRWTAGKGVDPRELALLAYGGNGPLFAAIQAQDLGIRTVLVPRASPAFSATGALAALPTVDEERAYLRAAGQADTAVLHRLWSELDARAEGHLADAGMPRAQLTVRYLVNLRYPGQNWSLAIEAAAITGARDLSFCGHGLVAQVVERFHRRHEQEYGHRRAAEEPEITGVRLVATAPVAAPVFGTGFSAPRRTPAPARVRRANLGRGFEPTQIHHGPALAPGDVIPAPAVIEETFTTIAVYPGWEACVDDAGDYVLAHDS
ncbi:MAG: hydantoinase/oxoprolinase family protein [Gammaproteobacteria bacterium]